MRKVMPYLGVAILVLVAGASGARADGPTLTLYYQGYFDAQATPLPPQGFVYRADPDTIQPSFYYQYRTRPVPLNDPGPQAPPAWINPGSNGQPLVFLSPQMLPGVYWYQDPNKFRQIPMSNLGYPFVRPQQ